MTCQPLRSGQEATSRYPPPNTVILTNLCNALLSRPDFYTQVLDAASRNSLSCIYLRKTPLSLSHHRLRGIWMTTGMATKSTLVSLPLLFLLKTTYVLPKLLICLEGKSVLTGKYTFIYAHIFTTYVCM